MANTVKVRMLVPRGDPRKGGILARGAKVDLPEAWAARFIADGTAVEAEAKEPAKPKAEPKPKGKKK